ncbi:MAG: cupin domain-containing protein [Rhodospirillales bacterium]
MSDAPKPPALNPGDVPVKIGTRYPQALKGASEAREKRALGDALGLKNFGVNLVRVRPGTETSIRHWHSKQDEFIYVLQGELTLITDEGEQILTTGLAAGFPANTPNGHCLANRSDRDAFYIEVGDRTPGDETTYSDVDMEKRWIDGTEAFVRKNGTPY